MFRVRVVTNSTPNTVVANEETKREGIPRQKDFITGNPQVETITGRLHLYRPNQMAKEIDSDEAKVPDHGTLLSILSVPAHLSPTELLEFAGAFKQQMLVMRILRDTNPQQYMVLIQFCDSSSAEQFYVAYNGRHFNSMEEARCKIVFVDNVEFDPSPDAAQMAPDSGTTGAISINGTTALSCTFPRPPSGMTEIPTCAVCLDRLDTSASGILTTSCNHTFHCDCLFRWEGSSCPVCRYSHGDIESACELCGTTRHLWICLICGHIGCGRYTGEHAKKHYQETLHAYSLEIATQRVWDYAGDGYVHRLILNKQDGKFVECPSPSVNINGERSQIPPRTDAEQEQHDHQKLEKLAMEYNFLLTSQLDEQRLYYERRLAEATEIEQRRIVTSLERDKRNLEKKNATLATKLHALEDELKFVKELNQSLISNQQHWQERVASAERLAKGIKDETDVRIADLESQVRDLMFYLDAQTKVSNSVDKDELEEGVVIVQESKQEADAPIPLRRKSSKKKKGKG